MRWRCIAAVANAFWECVQFETRELKSLIKRSQVLDLFAGEMGRQTWTSASLTSRHHGDA